MVKIHTHRVVNGKPGTQRFWLQGDTLRLRALADPDSGPDYLAQVVRTRDMGLGYGRGIYDFDRLIQLPVDAREGDTLYLFEATDSNYHTRYWLEREGTAQAAEAVRAYRHRGDHLEERQ